MAKQNITEAEWPIMAVLWERETAPSAEIIECVTSGRDVSKRTVKALLNRLIAKGAVDFTRDPHDSRVYHYRAAITREEVVRVKSRNFLGMVFDNSPMRLLTNFVKDSSLSHEEIAQLRALLEDKEKGAE